MNTQRSLQLSVAALLFVVLFSACEDKVNSELHYEAYEPVYMTRSELENSVKKTQPTEIQTPGKIYLYDDYIFINDPGKGVHVFNNEKPEEPVNVGFIEIPGNYDISIKNNLMYADNATDLVVIDIRDIENPTVLNRVQDVFTEVYPEGNIHYINIDPNKGVIVDWQMEHIVEKYDGDDIYYTLKGGDFMVEAFAADYSATNMARPASQTGQSGSLARFKIYQDKLYTLERWEMSVFDIEHPTTPIQEQTIPTSWQAETLFIRGNQLFIGTQSGMQVFSLENPELPSFISSLEHWRACDPVVVEGDYAYVTLRSGTSCGVTTGDELQVIDISNIYEPKLMAQFPMTSPNGLGIRNNVLFICDGNAGLKIYDAESPLNVGNQMIKQFPEIHALDVIPLENTLLMIGDDGLYQYDFSELNSIEQISHIAF